MIPEERKKDLYKQGYRLVGNHSSVKSCMWTKKAILKKDSCYKNKFYGINYFKVISKTINL